MYDSSVETKKGCVCLGGVSCTICFFHLQLNMKLSISPTIEQLACGQRILSTSCCFQGLVARWPSLTKGQCGILSVAHTNNYEQGLQQSSEWPKQIQTVSSTPSCQFSYFFSWRQPYAPSWFQKLRWIAQICPVLPCTELWLKLYISLIAESPCLSSL